VVRGGRVLASYGRARMEAGRRPSSGELRQRSDGGRPAAVERVNTTPITIGINLAKGVFVFLFCISDGVLGGFMCKKVCHRWIVIGHITTAACTLAQLA